MKPRMSTLTADCEEGLRCKAKQGWAIRCWRLRDLFREIDFLRGMINDLTQDGIMDVYNKGYEQCQKDLAMISTVTIDSATAMPSFDSVVDAVNTGYLLDTIDTVAIPTFDRGILE